MIRRAFIGLTVTAFAIVSSGCSSEPASELWDPVASYRAFVDQELERMKAKLPELEIDTDKRDVQKTDSLVSPLVGTWVMKCISPFDGEYPNIQCSVKLQMTHALQDGQWVLTEGLGTITDAEVKGLGLVGYDDSFMTDRYAERLETESFEFETLDELKKRLQTIRRESWR